MIALLRWILRWSIRVVLAAVLLCATLIIAYRWLEPPGTPLMVMRWLEGARLQIADIDSGRMLLHMHGKGNGDRYVPLAAPILPRLRDDWRTHRSLEWLFPAPTRRGLRHSLAHRAGPSSAAVSSVRFRRAWLESGIAKRASVHTLRHSYASH